MFNSRSDFDKCLKKGSFHDEIIILPLDKMSPEYIMTQVNKRDNNWRLCNARRLKGTDNAQFTKRTYIENVHLDEEKYREYFEKEIRPLLKRSNEFLQQKFPDVVF